MGLRYLFTGISGFVGRHYLELLARTRSDAVVFGMDLKAPELGSLPGRFRKNVQFRECQLLDQDSVRRVLAEAKPDRIVHLASFSSVAYSWKEPVNAFMNNTNIFLNIVETVRKLGLNSRVLSVGSSEEYGIVRKEGLPLREDSPLDPANPYAVARVSQEMLSRIYAKSYNVPVVCTRSFNHIGPGQNDIFAVSSFARQIVEAKRGKRKEIVCGNLEIVRDLIDVRDVVRAYELLLEKGRVGEVYNVCSGTGRKLSEVLSMLQQAAGTDIPVRGDPALMRPADNPVIVGSCEKLSRECAFKPGYPVEQSLKDVLGYWENYEA